MPQHKLVIIQDGSLMAMARDGRYQAAFPFLRNLLTVHKSKTCGHCAASSVNRAAAFQSAKRELAVQPQPKKAELKRLLNSEQVRIIYRNEAGKMISLTF
jgi:hypothetical protein